MSKHNRLTDLADAYCQTIEEMQEMCGELHLNFRTEMMKMADQWLEENTTDDKRGKDAA